MLCTPFHTKSWNIIIQWTSHDDLTEKSADTFFHFTETALTNKTREMAKAQNCTLRFDEKIDSIILQIDLEKKFVGP